MTTSNIISTPNITGNIGSCTIQTVQVYDKKTVNQQYGTNYITNSCTGVVVTTPFVNASPLAIMGMVCITILFVIVCFVGADMISEANARSNM